MPEAAKQQTFNKRQKNKMMLVMILFIEYKSDLKNVYQQNTKRLTTCLHE